jgi:hypothetical protein
LRPLAVGTASWGAAWATPLKANISSQMSVRRIFFPPSDQ